MQLSEIEMPTMPCSSRNSHDIPPTPSAVQPPTHPPTHLGILLVDEEVELVGDILGELGALLGLGQRAPLEHKSKSLDVGLLAERLVEVVDLAQRVVQRVLGGGHVGKGKGGAAVDRVDALLLRVVRLSV